MVPVCWLGVALTGSFRTCYAVVSRNLWEVPSDLHAERPWLE